MKFFSELRRDPQALAVSLVALMAVFGGGYAIGTHGQLQASYFSPEQPVGVDFDPFWKTWNLLNEKFVPATTTNQTTDQAKVWGAIEGLAQSYGDPYTIFFPPVESAAFAEDISGSFGGVGIEVGARDGHVAVIAPLKGSPAERAGVKAGDIIVRVGETVTENFSVDEVVRLLRGPVGEAVSFTLYREGVSDLIEVTVVRDTITIPTISTEHLDTGVFVIELYNFSAVSSTKFQNALREFLESGSDKLILDLRGNPGGYLEAAVDIASWFLPPGKIVVSEHFGDEGDRAHRSRGYNIFNDQLKMVVLVDRGSASASEILAGALKEHGVATLVGTRTFGKGSVQEVVPVTPDTSLKVTVAQWHTPNGTSISAGGLTPDIKVELTEEDVAAGRDKQKDAAVEFLVNQK